MKRRHGEQGHADDDQGRDQNVRPVPPWIDLAHVRWE
jgi:hypothetical protein